MPEQPQPKPVIVPQAEAKVSPAPAIVALIALLGVGGTTALLNDTKADEGEVHYSYVDMGGVWTACSGTTKGVGPNQKFTPEQCEGMTAADLLRAANTVLGCDPNLKGHQNQLRAAIRFQNNTGKLCSSTGGKLMRVGKYRAGCDALLAYNGIISGKPIRGAVKVRRLRDGRYFNVIRGLVNRRAAEHSICIKGLAA